MIPSIRRSAPAILVLTFAGLSSAANVPGDADRKPTSDDGTRFLLTDAESAAGERHERHAGIFGNRIAGWNRFVLAGVDAVQKHAPDGGGYFIGAKAKPPESPIGYALSLFSRPLLDPPRTTSYCSGASYAAFIEGLDRIYPDGAAKLSEERAEALRMQEPDGGRREDWVKFWGVWNADGYGCQMALVQYAGMGEEVTPERARPGDFMNISWTSGVGHSVVFLGWRVDGDGRKSLVFWSSQKGTNGLGDVATPVDKVRTVKIVRLTKPENLFTFDPAKPVNRKVPGDRADW